MELKSMKAFQPLDEFRATKGVLSSLFVGAASTVLTTIAFVVFMIINAKRTNDYVVDMNNCTCSCFDRQFKGHHFHASKQYRHIYFNLTPSAALAFLWSAGHFVLLWMYVSRAVSCLTVTLRYRNPDAPGALRWGVLALGSVSLYGLVYGWWVVFNYVNDAHYLSETGRESCSLYHTTH
ncbi:hypothetical protein M409DRAFT_19327 [Zasmidium cellare ATCC 36951]|uniref:Uncharacterized protein n=1 Tax=Zasmidium cellare ATCC 36951 TaxID=1080233 RepID=A0A6A6CTC3_ZASCE|nr:uncharacterized protein M409DRAFT_19327 [Zasmidium cellare ATCC 36951]KAF2170507.1 hypothetical protein M409DRAFT_19327 [Zasmidium cellare ATCC 36951]